MLAEIRIKSRGRPQGRAQRRGGASLTKRRSDYVRSMSDRAVSYGTNGLLPDKPLHEKPCKVAECRLFALIGPQPAVVESQTFIQWSPHLVGRASADRIDIRLPRGTSFTIRRFLHHALEQPTCRLARYSTIASLARHSDYQSHARVKTVARVEVFDKLCATMCENYPVTSGQARNRLPKAK